MAKNDKQLNIQEQAERHAKEMVKLHGKEEALKLASWYLLDLSINSHDTILCDAVIEAINKLIELPVPAEEKYKFSEEEKAIIEEAIIEEQGIAWIKKYGTWG